MPYSQQLATGGMGGSKRSEAIAGQVGCRSGCKPLVPYHHLLVKAWDAGPYYIELYFEAVHAKGYYTIIRDIEIQSKVTSTLDGIFGKEYLAMYKSSTF